MKISVSYLSAINDIKNIIDKINYTNCDYLHVDVMDGKFVSNKTPSNSQLLQVLRSSNKIKDIHLMVKDVIEYINIYKTLNPEYITFHLEATDKVTEIISYLKQIGVKVGLSIKPNTDVDKIIPYLDMIDLVLVMSVEPGLGGQKFITNSQNKIDQLKQIRELNNYKYVIEVDGGVNKDTISLCKNADILVVGSYITNSDDYQKQINEILY